MEHSAPLAWELIAPSQDVQGLGPHSSFTLHQHPLVQCSLLFLCPTHSKIPRQGFLNPVCGTQQECIALKVGPGSVTCLLSRTDCLPRAVAGVSKKDLSLSEARNHPSSTAVLISPVETSTPAWPGCCHPAPLPPPGAVQGGPYGTDGCCRPGYCSECSCLGHPSGSAALCWQQSLAWAAGLCGRERWHQ